MDTNEPTRVDFHGGPADGQYRIFRTPPGTVNWMTAEGPFVYELDETRNVYEPKSEEG